jgi:FkbM family methyltransferase
MTLQEWVLTMFPRPGFFVEAGAHDGIGDSATKILEDHGWNGICVEPSSAFAGLQVNRRCAVDNRCLWRVDNQEMEFWEVAGGGIELSGVKECFGDHWDRSDGRMIRKPTVSLATLLAEHGAPERIEFLSLDTEGSEYEILSGHEFSHFLFLVIAVEHNGVEPKREATRKLLAQHGYTTYSENPYQAIEEWFLHPSIR